MPRYPKGPVRPRQCHVTLTEDEHRRLAIVAAAENTTTSQLFRVIMLPEIDRRFEALGIRNGSTGNAGGNGHIKAKARSK